jgi:hypothetical protein
MIRLRPGFKKFRNLSNGKKIIVQKPSFCQKLGFFELAVERINLVHERKLPTMRFISIGSLTNKNDFLAYCF